MEVCAYCISVFVGGLANFFSYISGRDRRPFVQSAKNNDHRFALSGKKDKSSPSANGAPLWVKDNPACTAMNVYGIQIASVLHGRSMQQTILFFRFFLLIHKTLR